MKRPGHQTSSQALASQRTFGSQEVNMAAVFKKSKRNFRKKNVAEDQEEDDTEPQEDCDPVKAPIEIPFITDKPKIKKVKAVSSAGSLLSFDDDLAADDGQEFKVKKSKESRKLAKKLDQDRKKKDKETLPKKIEGNDGEVNSQKEATGDIADDDKIAALREELSKMSRTEDDDEEDDEQRSKKPGNDSMLTSGGHVFSIPDAAAIHAARKKREMARQMGTGQDFVPLDDTDRYSGRFGNTSVNSRLVREDDNDASDDEDGPIKFSVAAGQKSFPAMDRRREVQNALVNEEEEDKNHDDSELHRWEEEQIRKGVSVQQLPDQQQMAEFRMEEQMNASQSTLFGQTYMYGGNYASGALGVQTNGAGTQTLYPSQPQQVVTIDMICDRMSQRLLSLQEVNRGHKLEMEKLATRVEASETSIDNLQAQGTAAEKRFGFFQEMRGYVRDLIECLNEKVGQYAWCAVEGEFHEGAMLRLCRVAYINM